MEAFIQKLASLNLFLEVKGEDLALKGKKGKLSKSDIEQIKKNKEIVSFIKANKADLLDHLQQAEAARPKQQIEAMYELSPLQEGMLFHGLFDTDSGNYIEQLAFNFPEGLDIEAFRSSWEFVLQNHTVLRSSFVYDELKIPVQCVHKKVALPFQVIDYSHLDQEQQEQAIATYLQKDIAKGFDFTEAPLIRIVLIKTNAVAYKMVWTYHHILYDGWSMSILTDELLEAYEYFARGNTPPVQEVDNFGDYIQYINDKDKYEEERFWKGYMQGFDSPALLPFGKSTELQDEVENIREKLDLTFEETYTEALRQFAQRNRLTVNTIVQGTWALLLSRYTGNSDIVYGVTVSGRPSDLEDAEDRIGLYINTLPLRTQLSEQESILNWLADMQDGQTQAREFQYTSLSQIQSWSKVQGDFFDTFLVFENYPERDTDNKEVLLKIEYDQYQEASNYLICIEVNLDKTLHICFDYNRFLLSEQEMQTIKGHFEHILQQIAAIESLPATAQTLENLALITPLEKALILGEVPTAEGEWFNRGAIDFGNDRPIHVRFEEQVELYPNAIAISHNGESWTFQQLNQKANQIAHSLRAMGVTKDTFVGVYLQRCPELVASLLGILKAGGIYVPLDIQNPIERIQKMVYSSGIVAIVSHSDLGAKINQLAISKLLLVDHCDNKCRANHINLELRDQKDIAAAPITNIPNETTVTDWAYMLFTSGSTGEPKGAITRHDGALNHILAEYELMELADGFSFLQSAGIGSDISVWQMLAPLLKGGKVVIIDKFDLLDYEKVTQLLVDEAVSVVEFVPSYCWGLVEYFSTDASLQLPDLNWVMMVGEAVPVKLVNAWRNLLPQLRIVNAYGPCEASDDITQYEVTGLLDEMQRRVPIGRSLQNMNMFVVNSQGNLCAIGEPGELCVSGVGVGAGYWQMQEKTAAAFIPNPFENTLGEILYKTGDLGRWLPDGNLEFLGRIDRQVKIRGNRVELGEVESFLREQAGVEAIHVMPYVKANQKVVLLAFVVAEEGFNGNSLRKKMLARASQGLPYFMQPSHVCIIEAIPQNLSDKVDEKQLLQLFLDSDQLEEKARNLIPCQTETETAIHQIWQKILGVQQISTDDNFFELGGHSLLAIRVIAAIKKAMGLKVDIRDLFVHKTITRLAHFIDIKAEEAQLPPIKIQERPERIPLSFAQERLWFIDQLDGSTHYHMPSVLRLKGQLDLDALEYAFRAIVDRHEILRTVYRSEKGDAYQLILPEGKWTMQHLQVSPEAAEALIENVIDMPFDLANDHMLRVQLLELPEQEYMLVMVLHHIASDGWSESILVEELVNLYQAKMRGQQPELAPLAVQYADFAIWQLDYLQGEVLEQKLQFWEDTLSGFETLHLPTDFQRPAIQSTEGACVNYLIPRQIAERLHTLAQEEEATLFMVLIAAFNVLLQRYSNQDDICIGTPTANRIQEEVEPLIGFFVNTLVLRNDLSGDPGFLELLSKVKAKTLDAFAHQDVPFEKIVDRVVGVRELNRMPIFQVMLVLQTTEKVEAFHLDGVELADTDFENDSAKFDLTFNISETEEGLDISAEYCTELFLPQRIEQLLQHFEQLLQAIVRHPIAPISQLSMVDRYELEQLSTFNQTEFDYQKSVTLIDLFEQQVQQFPEKEALVYCNESLTYSELDRRTNQMAQAILSQGIEKGESVGLLAERSLEMIIGMLGILKAGGVYIPLNLEYPAQRLQFQLEDTEAKLIVYSSESVKDRLHLPNYTYLAVAKLNKFDDRLPQIGAVASDGAYIMYTSGTTGKPKGILVEHQNITKLIVEPGPMQVFPEDRMMQWSNFSFDGSTYEIYIALMNGATLCLLPEGAAANPEQLKRILQQQQITISFFTTALFNALVDYDLSAFAGMRKVLFGGEAASLQHVQKAFDVLGSGKLINGYGPTETTVFATQYEINERLEDMVPLGRPLANTKIHILNRAGQPAGVGVVGELCISGHGVARGYIKRPKLNATRFVEDPFSSEASARMYKTGDLGYWNYDGTITFLGRRDDQVKIRGFRIEPGEIAKEIQASPMIKQCVVLVKTDSSGNKRLVAYLVGTADLDLDQLRETLSDNLPEYMVPSLMIEMESMPLTINGKVNKRALPEPDTSALGQSNNYIAPRNATETQLATIWSEVLAVKRIGIHDNFFDAGGHSILAIKLMAQVNADFGSQLHIAALFECPTIDQLGKKLLSAQQSDDRILLPLNDAKGKSPIFAVPGGGGNVMDYYDLAKAFEPNTPLFAFQAPGLDGRREALTTVEAMAETYVEALLEHNHEGPYRLAGYSFGGNVALEMAIQLRERGHEVSELMLFDTDAPGLNLQNVEEEPATYEEALLDTAEDIAAFYDTEFQMPEGILTGKPKEEQLQLVYEQLSSQLNMEASVSQFKGFVEVYMVSISSQYKPSLEEPLKVPIVLYQALQSIEPEALPQYGWEQLTSGDIQVIKLDATHDQLLDEPFAAEIAQQMKLTNKQEMSTI